MAFDYIIYLKSFERMIATRYMASSIGKAASSRSFLNRQFLIANSARIRSMSSVSVLEDMDELEKFSQLNHKSVLYFTATWYVKIK